MINWITQGDNLLFAPIPPTGEKDSEVYGFLKRLEKDRSLYETRRLLYVAATRTKKQLHLFGHTQMTKDGIAPQSPSSLKHLWPFIASDWEKAYEDIKPVQTPTLKSKDTTQYLHRLPLHFEAPSAPPNLKTEPAMDISLEDVTPFEWAGNEARYLGNVLHRAFETIANEGIEHWDETRIAQMKPSFKAALLEEGISHQNLDKSVQTGLRAVLNILKHDKGRWILQRHQDHKAEYSLTSIKDKNFKSKIIDRTFIDEEGTRWIIDYKTGEDDGEDLEGILDENKVIKQYRPQLETYEQLIRLQGETGPIKKALYYPLHQRLIEILPE